MAGIVLVLSNDNNQADEHLTASSIQDIPLDVYKRQMLCINVLPSSTAFTTLAKLLSVKTMSAASFATSDPSCIPKPTSASVSYTHLQN